MKMTILIYIIRAADHDIKLHVHVLLKLKFVLKRSMIFEKRQLLIILLTTNSIPKPTTAE